MAYLRPSLLSRPSQVRMRIFSHIDIPLITCAVMISLLGLITMNSFASENAFFERQVIWLAISIGVFIIASQIDYRFLRRTWPVALLFAVSVVSLALVYVFGDIVKGAQSRFNLGVFAIQPSDPAKLILVILLAKYFARRHIEIKHIRHILVSGLYAAILFFLILLQPDFGSAIIIAAIWFGVVLVAGISRKHLIAVLLTGLIVSGGLWSFVLADYQKQRVLTFLNPLSDIQGSGYNAYQATVAVGSGQLFGKGIGYGTQSKLKFLPEYETDFIFAAFAEEWGFAGVALLFLLFGIVIWRILAHASQGGSNFEALFAIGLAVFLTSHFVIHVGINLGLLPVTGTTIPFMSYGGSHLLTEFLGLGILNGMRRYGRTARRTEEERELLGIM